MANEKRLIDANEALRMMWNSKADNPCTDTIRKGVWNVAHDCAISCVDSCQTIDAVPVVHGRWIEGEMVIDDGVGGHIYHCSECDDWYHAFTPNYCPNCGAKMDGDGNG